MHNTKIASFLHLSDVHLGKINSISRKENRYEDFFTSFNSAIDFAIKNKVNFVLISGDLFDTQNPSPKTLSKCEEILIKLKHKDIDVFCIEGNHDKKKMNEKMSWIDYLQEKDLIIHLSVDFSIDNKPKIINYDLNRKKGTLYKHPSGINIIGFGWLGVYECENNIKVLLEQLEGNRNLILLHAILDDYGSSNLGYLDKELFKDYLDNIIYIALGHGHTKKSYYDKIYNAGSLEYIRLRDFDNPNRGYYYVNIYEDSNTPKIEVEHILSKKRDFIRISIDITNINTEEELEYIVINKIVQNWEKGMNCPLILVELTGSSDFLSRHSLPIRKIEKKISERDEFLTLIIEENIDFFSEKLVLRGGMEVENGLSMEELGRKTVMEVILSEFHNDNLIDEKIALKLTDIIWDSYKEIIEGLDEGKKESFIKNIYSTLWEGK
jgi:DNA repair exonuclease SbcCD nuclease subunit